MSSFSNKEAYVENKSLVKISMNLPEELLSQIRATATSECRSVTEVIRRAIERDLFLKGEEDKGAEVLLKRADGSTAHILLRLP